MLLLEIYKISILSLSIFFLISCTINTLVFKNQLLPENNYIFLNFKEILLRNKNKKTIFTAWLILIIIVWPILIFIYFLSILKIVFKLLINKNIILEINIWQKSFLIYNASMKYISLKDLIVNLFKSFKLAYECASFLFIYKILKKDKINFINTIYKLSFYILLGFSFIILIIADKLVENWEFHKSMIINNTKGKKIKIKILYIIKVILKILIATIFDNILKPIALSITKKIIKENWRIKLNGLKHYISDSYFFFIQKHVNYSSAPSYHNCIYFKNMNKIVWYTGNGRWLIKDDVNGIIINKFKNDNKRNQWMMVRNEKNNENIESLGLTDNFIENNDLNHEKNYTALITKAKIYGLLHLVNNNEGFKYLIVKNDEEIEKILKAKNEEVENLCLNSRYAWIRDTYVKSIYEHYKLTEHEDIFK